MEVSKLAISLETRSKLVSMSHLSPKGKRKIRIDGVKKLINENPYKKFSVTDLAKAAGYRIEKSTDNQYMAGQAFIKKLTRDGIIIKNEERRHSTWCTKDKVKSIKQTTRTIDLDIEDLKTPVTVKNPNLGGVRPGAGRPKGSKGTDKLMDAAMILAEEMDKHKDKESNYSFSFVIEKRNNSGEFGKQKLISIEMNNVLYSRMKHMVNESLDNVA